MIVDIDFDPAHAAENKLRWNAAYSRSIADRPPVAWGVANRMMLKRRGSSFAKFCNDPITQLVEQVLNFKWIAENLPGDMVNGLSVTVQPQFENVSNSNAFGCEVAWSQDQPPQAIPILHTLEDLETYQPPPVERTLWGRMTEFYHVMHAWLGEGNLRVTMRGEPVTVDAQLHVGGESPFMIATDLCGPNLYDWLTEAPDLVHRLLGIITDRFIETERQMRQVCKSAPKGCIFLADDTAQIISLAHFREFVVPYTGRIYDEFAAGPADRVMHMCGRHAHLYPALLNDLKICGLWGYGSRNQPEEVRDSVGGRIWLLGNIDPFLLAEGPTERIEQATRRLLDALTPCGGIIVADGYNLVPETPLRHLQTVANFVKAYFA